MRCVIDQDPADFLAATEAFRRAEPYFTNAITTNATERASGRIPLEPRSRWFHVLDDGNAVCGAAIRIPGRCVLVSRMTTDAAAALATTLAATAAQLGPLPGVEGPTAEATAVIRRYVAIAGQRDWTTTLEERLLVCDQVVPPTGVLGERRAATTADEHLIVRWLTDFTAEAVPGSLPPTPDSVRRRLSHATPGIWLWCVNEEPTSLCWQSVPAAGIVRVSVVYTPEDHRRHGYASANVAAVTRRAFDAGASACMLYTDRANPTSNRVYESIGYRYAGDAVELRFIGPTRWRAGDWPGSAPADGSSRRVRARYQRS